MALRIATLETAAHDDLPRTPREWQAAVARLAASAASVVRIGDADALTALYRSIGDLGDAQRAYQARCRVTEAVLSESVSLEVAQWRSIFAAAAVALLEALDAEPAEPVLLNYTGVLLYELGELGGAEALFAAARARSDARPRRREPRRGASARRRRRPHSLRPRRAARARARRPRAARRAAARPAQGLTVSLCMIVKDEEEMLPGCLEAVAGAVDEMIIVDTGSTDRTVEIAESFGAKVIHFPWNGSFSDARNVGLEHATGDWVVYLDADEHLVPEDAPKIRDAARPHLARGLLPRRDELHRRRRVRLVGRRTSRCASSATGPSTASRAGSTSRRRGNMPTYLPERFETTTIRIRHYGYLKSRISAKEKSRRNIELLLELEAREAPSAVHRVQPRLRVPDARRAATAAEHLDARLGRAAAGRRLDAAGYAPMLASRIALARRAGRTDRRRARGARESAIAAMPDHTELISSSRSARAPTATSTRPSGSPACLELGDAPAALRRRSSARGTYLALCLLAEIAGARRPPRRGRGALPPLARASIRTTSRRCCRLRRCSRAAAPSSPSCATLLPLDRPSAPLLAATACLEAAALDEAEASCSATSLERQPGNDAARIGLVETLLASAGLGTRRPPAAALRPGRLAARGGRSRARSSSRTPPPATQPALRAALAEARSRLAQRRRALPAPGPTRSRAASAVPASRRPLPTAPPRSRRCSACRSSTRSSCSSPCRERSPSRATSGARCSRGIYLRRGFLDSAAEEWIASANERPTARAFVGLAQVALARSLPDDAVVFAEHALALDPGTTRPPRARAPQLVGRRAEHQDGRSPRLFPITRWIVAST